MENSSERSIPMSVNVSQKDSFLCSSPAAPLFATRFRRRGAGLEAVPWLFIARPILKGGLCHDRLFSRTWRQLHNARFLADHQIGHQDDPGIGELQRIMMLGRLVQIDLPESSQPTLDASAEKQALNIDIFLEGDFGAWTKTNFRRGVRGTQNCAYTLQNNRWSELFLRARPAAKQRRTNCSHT